MFTKSNLAVYINNQLQTTVGQKAMVDLRSRVMGLKVRYTTIKNDFMCNKAARLVICTHQDELGE